MDETLVNRMACTLDILSNVMLRQIVKLLIPQERGMTKMTRNFPREAHLRRLHLQLEEVAITILSSGVYRYSINLSRLNEYPACRR